MNINKDWNYKYELFFNKNKNVLEKYFDILTSDEKYFYEKEKKYFSNHFTFQTLLDALKHNKNNKKMLFITQKRSNCIQNTPICLKKYYQAIIDKNYPKYKKELSNLLELSINSKIYFDDYRYFSYFFDKKFLNDFLKKNPYKCYNYNPIACDNIQSVINNFNAKNPNNLNYDIVVQQGELYGEFWSAKLYKNCKKDTLVLYNNPNWTYDDIYYTIVHEINGHAKMFEKLKNFDKFIDMSSNIIIEGYATYQELIDKSNPLYIENLKHKYYDIIKLAFSKNYDEMSKKYGYETVIKTNQYPTFLLSYYLGAFKFLKTKKMQDLNFILNYNFTNNLIKIYK